MIEKKPFNEKIETQRLILKPNDLSFETAEMLYNVIKKNKKFLTRFLPRLLNAKSPEAEYAFLISCDEKWKSMRSPVYGIIPVWIVILVIAL